MHTQGIWIVKKQEKIAHLGLFEIESHEDGYIRKVASFLSKDDAKHIVQMNNSFDGLVIICNLIEEDYRFYDEMGYDKKGKYKLTPSQKKLWTMLKRAIAKAENK